MRMLLYHRKGLRVGACPSQFRARSRQVVSGPMHARLDCSPVPTDRVSEDQPPDCMFPVTLRPSGCLWSRRAMSRAERRALSTAGGAETLADGTHSTLDSSIPDTLGLPLSDWVFAIRAQCKGVEHGHQAGSDTPSSVINPKMLSKRLCISVAYEPRLFCSHADSCFTFVLADICIRGSLGEFCSLVCVGHGGRVSVRLTEDFLGPRVPDFDSRHCLGAGNAFLIHSGSP